MFIELFDRDCPLCNSKKSTFLFQWKDYRYSSVENEFSYHQCDGCGHIYLKSYPRQEDVVKLYPATLMNYGDIEESGSMGYKIKNYLDLQGIKKIVTKNNIRKIRALDVGCGTGLYLDQLKKLGDSIEIDILEGMEISEHAGKVAKKKGYKIHDCLLEDFKENTKYNIIILQQVVEHLYDLDKAFEIMYNMLEDDGIIILETPNLDCVDRKIFGKYWEGYHIPRHFNLFDKDVFGNWLKKKNLYIKDYQIKIKPVHWIYSIQNKMLEKNAARGRDNFSGMAKFFTYKNTFLLLFFAGFDVFQLLFLRKSSDIRYIVKRSK